MSPSLVWDKQFCMMVGKLKEAVRKLKNTEMITTTASMYYNAYLITNVYYGYGILNITSKQEEILKKIYEPIILQKLQLSIKFPRKILYARKSALGVGLMAPSTIIDSLALKAYVSHQRGESNISKIIQILEQNVWLQYGYYMLVMETPKRMKPKQLIWSDKVQHKLEKWQIMLINRLNEKDRITRNKTIMDYAVEYAKRENAADREREAINHVRIYKNMILPFEVVGFRGGQETKEYKNVFEKSSVRWKVSFDVVPKPCKRLIETWTEFLKWLKEQQIETIIDFQQSISIKFLVSNDLKYVQVKEDNEELYFERERESYGHQIYGRRVETPNAEWR